MRKNREYHTLMADERENEKDERKVIDEARYRAYKRREAQVRCGKNTDSYYQIRWVNFNPTHT